MALQKLLSYLQVFQKQFVSTEEPVSIILPEVLRQKLFDKNNNIIKVEKSNQQRPPFHLHENSLINHRDATETAIEIIAAKQPITDMVLCRYLKQRRIDKVIADIYCHEVVFKFSNKKAKHTAIGFKNSADSYELRNEYFKLSSSPKYVNYIKNLEYKCDAKTDEIKGNFNLFKELKNEDKNDNKNLSKLSSVVSQNDVLKSSLQSDLNSKIEQQNHLLKGAESIAVFEGFFDFLTYQTIIVISKYH